MAELRRRHDRLMTAHEVADWLQVPLATLYAWRTRGLGPRMIRVGRHLRAKPADVDAWLEQQATSGGRVA